ncbi:MAG: molybdate ABC transporter substrate-binding protein [Acidimicrobiales bacterium]
MATLTALSVVASACSSSSPSADSTTTTRTTEAGETTLTGSITVSAAASLTSAFQQLGSKFQAVHPGTTITFNFGSSGVLATQIEHGAPADVLASADTQVMDQARGSGDIEGTPVIFARNTLEMVVKPGNPLGITSPADLTKAPVVALCAASAPCGTAASTVLHQQGIVIPISKISLGQDVKATLSQVTLGDADAAIVYVTDAMTVGRAGEVVPIPASKNIITSYPIAVVRGTSNASLAKAWIGLVTGPTGQKVLGAAGFLPPH